MVESIYRAMYGTSAQIQPIESEVERQKRAVKILGGMKVHNSHVKTIRVGDDLIDVPKVDYIQLLEGQIKELRERLRRSDAKMIRLENNQSRTLSELSDIRRELAGKVNLR